MRGRLAHFVDIKYYKSKIRDRWINKQIHNMLEGG
jgi:hypothetical protein